MKQPNADELANNAAQAVEGIVYGDSAGLGYLPKDAAARIILEETHLSRLIQEREELLKALRDLFAMMDEGLLVRDLTDDAADGWAMKQIGFVFRLRTAHSAIDLCEKD